MTFPSPLITPLPSMGAAALTWSAVGTMLQVDAAGNITGQTAFDMTAGSPYGVGVTGVPFVLGDLPTATLTIANLPPTLLACVPAPDGSTPSGYGLVFIIPPDVTVALPAGYYPYQITVANDGGVTGLVLAGECHVSVPPVPLPLVLRRGTAATLTLFCTWATDPPNFPALSLVWEGTMEQSTVLTKTEAAGEITTSSLSTTQLSVVVALAADDTSQLAAGLLTWSLSDAPSASTLGTGTITLL